MSGPDGWHTTGPSATNGTATRPSMDLAGPGGRSSDRAIQVAQPPRRRVLFVVLLVLAVALSAARLGEHRRLDMWWSVAVVLGMIALGAMVARATMALERSHTRHTSLREQLEDQHVFSATLFQTLREGVVVIDDQSRIVSVNKSWCEMTQRAEQELVGMLPPYPWWPEGERGALRETFAGLLRAGVPFEVERPVHRPDGSVITVLGSGVPVHGGKDRERRWVLVYKDITERKAAELELTDHAADLESLNAALAAANEFNASMIEHAPYATLVVDESGSIVTANPMAADLFGYAVGALEGSSVDVLVPASARAVHPRLRATYAKHPTLRPMGAGLDLMALRADGSELPVDIMLSPFTSGSRRLVLVVVRDVSERRMVELARREADRANEAKSEFLSRMSHELRTPLAAMLGFTDILREEAEGLAPQQRDMLDRMGRAGRHLMDLINDALDISRIEAGHLVLSMEPVDAREAVDRAVELVDRVVVEKGLRCTVSVPPACTVRADRARLQQVLVNLLSNAAKYNRPSGTITVRAAKVEGFAELHVEDTGPGIEASRLGELFTPFSRLGAEGSLVEGTGLGLTLSKALAEQMGGSLSLVRTGPEGTAFALRLPLATSMDGTTGEDRSVVRRADTAGLAQLAARIACIEDNDDNVVLIRSFLQRFRSLEVEVANDGATGLELVRHARPDVVLLDLHLPDMDGRQVLATLRGDRGLRHLPVVVLTADAMGARRAEVLALGANAYFTKPIDLDAFASVLAELLAPIGRE